MLLVFIVLFFFRDRPRQGPTAVARLSGYYDVPVSKQYEKNKVILLLEFLHQDILVHSRPHI